MKTKIQDAFKNAVYSVLVYFVVFISVAPLVATAQDVPAELNSLVSMKLDDAQNWLEKNGYEIAGSSLFKKEQLWYNEKQNVCVSMTFEKKGDHTVTGLKPGDEAKCKEGVAAARKVTDSYHDGPAPANAAAIEKEREKLQRQRFCGFLLDSGCSPRPKHRILEKRKHRRLHAHSMEHCRPERRQ